MKTKPPPHAVYCMPSVCVCVCVCVCVRGFKAPMVEAIGALPSFWGTEIPDCGSGGAAAP